MLVAFFFIFKSSIWQEGLSTASFVVHLYYCTVTKRFVQFRANQWFDLFLETLIKKNVAVTWQFKCVTQGAGNPNQIRWRWSLVWKTPSRVQIKVCLSLTRHQPAILSTLIATLKSNLIIWRVLKTLSLLLSLSLSLYLSLSLLTSLSLSLFSSCHVSVSVGILQLQIDWQYYTQLLVRAEFYYLAFIGL